MSIWAGIKHALNSTLGTSDFKSLDKLITEQTRMIPSDTPYLAIEGGSIATEPVNTTVTLNLPTKIKMTRHGIGRFTGVLGRTTYSKMKGTFYIYKNGAEVFQFSRTPDYGTNSETFSADLSFEPGDIFSFKLTGLNNTATNNTRQVSINSLALNGSIEHNVCEVVS